jgi:5-formyltetrahydrofolate cyclo-ligase
MSDRGSRKATIRRETIARIMALSEADREFQEATLTRQFATLPGLDRAEFVLLYASAFPEEIHTAAMLNWVLAQGKRLVCPRVDRKAKQLRLHEIVNPAEDFQPGTLGIPEPRRGCPLVDPAKIDWVLVPGLAFDGRGFRVGRGAGHYDRLLPKLRPEVPRWALILDPQWVDEVPDEPHDEPLDGIISPSREVNPRPPRPARASNKP